MKVVSRVLSMALTGVLFCSFAAKAVKYAGEYSPSWSPDGQWLAYHVNSEKMSWDIVIKNIATGEIEQITNDANMDVDPSWSPDGQKLTFASNRNGNWDIYIYDRKNRDISVVAQRDSKDISPKWSPLGNHIVFVSDRDGDQQLYQLALDSNNVTQLTHTGQDINHPSFSDDGNYIQFDQYFAYEGKKGGRSKIFQLALKTNKVTHLYSAHGSSIAAKRVGDQLYVSNNRKGNWDIYRIDLQTGEETPVVHGDTNEMKGVVDSKSKRFAYSLFDQQGLAKIKVKQLD